VWTAGLPLPELAPRLLARNRPVLDRRGDVVSEIVKRNNETFSLLKRMEDAGAASSVHLDLSARTDLDLSSFEAIARYLGRLHDTSKWLIADLLLQAEQRFGESAYQIAAATGRSERTLSNWCWVASRIPPSRRRETLPMTQHALVAPLEPSEQKRWLDRAETERWSSRELKAAIEAEREIEAESVADKTDCHDLLDAAVDALQGPVSACYGDVPFELVIRPIPGAEDIIRPSGGAK
jgi:hypothetical protein